MAQVKHDKGFNTQSLQARLHGGYTKQVMDDQNNQNQSFSMLKQS